MIIIDARCAMTVIDIEIHILLDPMVVGRRKYVRTTANSSTTTVCPRKFGVTASRRIIAAASIGRK